MKYFALIIFYTTVCHVVAYDPYNIMEQTVRSPTIGAISDMLKRNCKNKTAELEEQMISVKKCYLGVRETETICSVMRERLIKCVEPVVELMETCLKSTKYDDMPHFTMEVVHSVSDFVCQTKGEKLIELLHPCLVKLGYQKHHLCLKSFKQKLSNIEKDDTITNVKTDICKSLETTKTCFLKEFKDTCKNDVTLNSAVAFYDAVITKPCKHGRT